LPSLIDPRVDSGNVSNQDRAQSATCQ
jgi:hypothetical protein